MAKNKDWMKTAVKHPGALTKTAKRAGALKKDGDIKVSWLRDKAKGDGVTAKRARLALTFRKSRKK
jgi:hypothetical protein